MTEAQSDAMTDLEYGLWFSEAEDGGLEDAPYPRMSMHITVNFDASFGATKCQM